MKNRITLLVSLLVSLLAVLERRCGIFSRSSDVYVNVAGGLSIQDPAADLSICASLASSLKDIPISPDTCLIGEVGLAGEVRPASRSHLRIREAARLGFKNAVVSAREKLSVPADSEIKIIKVFAVSSDG